MVFPTWFVLFIRIFVTTLLLWPEWLLLALLIVAALYDHGQRRVPNPLALAMVSAGALAAIWPGVLNWLDLFHWGLTGRPESFLLTLATNAIAAGVVAGLLVGIEAVWRRVRGSVGLGMGDVKLLFALMVASPTRGLVSFAVALVLLAIVGAATHRRSLPLVPFILPSWAVLSLVSWVFLFQWYESLMPG